MNARHHCMWFRILCALIISTSTFVTVTLVNSETAEAQMPTSVPIWRLQAHIRVGNVENGGTDNSVGLTIGDSPIYWLDYGRDDFERNSDFTYDIPFDPAQLDAMDDIQGLTLSKTGDDGLCVQELQLLVNGVSVFEWSAQPCLWLDNEQIDQRYLSFSAEELRANPDWQENPAIPLFEFTTSGIELRITHTEMESRVEGLIGHYIHGSRLYWGKLHGRAVEGQKTNENTLHVDLDLAAEIDNWWDAEVDVDFDIQPSCYDGQLSLHVQNMQADVDSSWYSEFLSLGILEIIDSLANDRISDAVQQFGYSVGLSSTLPICPEIKIEQGGDIVFIVPLTDLMTSAPTESVQAQSNSEQNSVEDLMLNWAGFDQQGIGMNEVDDLFGSSLAAGDFDGDGITDLAVGAPGEAPGADPTSGYVFIFKGTASGLAPWTGLDQSPAANESDDRFGASLAAGDFNGDSRDDLAVGLPGEELGAEKSGFVILFQGTPNGLVNWAGLDQQGMGANEAGDLFGSSLAAGDFDGDGVDDLAVGAPGEAPGGAPKSGYLFTFHGTTSGLTPWTGLDQSPAANESDDRFGSSLTVGDFNGDGRDDLAVGLPGEELGAEKSGFVILFQGTPNGLVNWAGLDQQGMGANETGDLFGSSLAAGDFDGDSVGDLAVGAPGEAPSADPESGYLFTFRGTTSGLTPWTGLDQNPAANESDDRFGSSLTAGDFNGDGRDDLAVGLPGEELGAKKSGFIILFQGTPNGLVNWAGLDQQGIGANEAGDLFGSSLAAGDFDGDGVADLAVGAPGEAPGSDPTSGYVFTFKGIRVQ